MLPPRTLLTTRRSFLGTGATALAIGLSPALPLSAAPDTQPTGPNMLGPLPGYSPRSVHSSLSSPGCAR